MFSRLYDMIIQYKKYNGEKPYVMLVTSKTYFNIRNELKDNAFKYLTNLETDNDKINYIFGIPIEISNYILPEAICMNERDYRKYCEYKYLKDRKEI